MTPKLEVVVEAVRLFTTFPTTKKSVEQREIHSEGAGIDWEEVSLAS